jgi:SAM-dependent methyltransferase
MLVVPENEIRCHGPGKALAVCRRQWYAERDLARRGIHFRASDPDAVAAAYAAMSAQDFAGINARQDWANWRTIPRALSGHVPDRPLQVVDLGCGTGSSTRVLAFYCPAGSRITAYELVPRLLEVARTRVYVHRSGRSADVSFVNQGVTAPLRDAGGDLLPDHGVDVVNASGVVGHHLTAETMPSLIKELQRILGRDGVAMLDVGPSLPAKVLHALMHDAGFQSLGRFRSWLLDPTGQMVFRRCPC